MDLNGYRLCINGPPVNNEVRNQRNRWSTCTLRSVTMSGQSMASCHLRIKKGTRPVLILATTESV